jgi:hypothetical protein
MQLLLDFGPLEKSGWSGHDDGTKITEQVQRQRFKREQERKGLKEDVTNYGQRRVE